MFNSEESIKVVSELPIEEVEDALEDATRDLGRISFRKKGGLEIQDSRFRSFFTEVNITGRLVPGRKENEWIVSLRYSVAPSVACWVIVILGFLFCVFGPLLILVPLMAKNEIDKAVVRSLRDFRDDVEPE